MCTQLHTLGTCFGNNFFALCANAKVVFVCARCCVQGEASEGRKSGLHEASPSSLLALKCFSLLDPALLANLPLIFPCHILGRRRRRSSKALIEKSFLFAFGVAGPNGGGEGIEGRGEGSEYFFNRLLFWGGKGRREEWNIMGLARTGQTSMHHRYVPEEMRGRRGRIGSTHSLCPVGKGRRGPSPRIDRYMYGCCIAGGGNINYARAQANVKVWRGKGGGAEAKKVSLEAGLICKSQRFGSYPQVRNCTRSTAVKILS